MLAKKRRNPEASSQQNNLIIYAIFSVFAFTLIIALVSSNLLLDNIPIILLGLLFIGIIFFILTMKREGGEQESTFAARKGSATKVRKGKDAGYHHSTSEESAKADGSMGLATTKTDQDTNEKKGGRGSFGTKNASFNNITSTKRRSLFQHKKMQDTIEEEEALLPPDGEQKSTPIPEELWNFPKELLDRYEPLGVLGDDDYAVVYLIRNKKEDAIRSLKISKSTESASEIVKKESSIWRKMKHPNIVKLYTGEFDQLKFLENEYVSGVSYKGKHYLSLLDLPKPIKEKYAVSLVLDIANALAYVHNLGLRHYHLQPGNIFITPKLEAKVSGFTRGKNEFGFATNYATINLQDESDERIAHIAPEQRDKSNETLNTRTDLYQLGIIFYELLTGYKPYTKCLYQFVYPHADENQINDEYDHFFIPPSRIVSRLAPYDNMVQHLIAQEKKERYASVKEFVTDLKAL
jgi:serine/threonine protein kinase